MPSRHAKTVVLNLVQPLAAVRQFCRFDRKARRDEPSRKRTLQHADLIKSGNGNCNFAIQPALLARAMTARVRWNERRARGFRGLRWDSTSRLAMLWTTRPVSAGRSFGVCKKAPAEPGLQLPL